ncbi:hypothetical protein EST38_g10417 [Candolleomyces aberdarensis]|uniref:Fungal-type protein kinase domain-containing protein n=1 Tax=Candolleomyces aberdarensis TaxID=2316362 RepID=A0A4Q2D929_9AGAR|nr:hypothetical protein EST38_g10417 [Candolleomyces aberdarensis]
MPPTSHDTPCANPDGAQVPAPTHMATIIQPICSPSNPFHPEPEHDCKRNPIVTPSRTSEAILKRLCERPLSVLSRSSQERLKSASSSFAQNQHCSTPYNARISEPLKLNPKRDEHKKLIKLELGTLIGLNDNGAWAKSLYAHLVGEAELDEFLEESDLYNTNTGRWTAIPESTLTLTEDDLYEPFVNISNAILKKFVLNTCKKEKLLREAIDTHATNLPHQEEAKTTLVSRPDVSIKGQGPSFQVPEADSEGNTPEVGFSNMNSFEEMKVERQRVSPTAQGLQVGVYVRQIFIHQPNRRFVRALVLTETHVRLFHFDRSGGLYTPYINIHEDPYTFIRLVVGLNSLDDSVLGFDTSIQWRIEDGRKVDGTLTTRRDDNTEIKYNLSKVAPVITFFDIRGRGTQCWSVFDPTTGDKLLVKDCWKAEDRVPEYDHLKELKGVQGVAQMISFETNRGETKEFRATGSTAHGDFHNRVAIRIVMSSYGESIENFKSAMELLCAFRDAIKGHMNLYKTKRLHRDVTIHNVLLGKKADGSEPDPGYCGILIDLYMAIQSERKTLSAEQRMASRLFLSVVILKSCKDPVDDEEDQEEEEEEQLLQLAHDHLDDLEAFLYIYTYIIHVHDANGASYNIPQLMKKWKRDHPSAVVDSKHAFLSKGTSSTATFRQRWPAQCVELLDSFRKFIFPHVVKKINVMEGINQRNNVQTEVKYMMNEVVDHYNTVLHLFNDAIDGLEECQSGFENVQPGNAGRFTTPPLDPESPTPHPGQNPLKRMGGYLGQPPLAKRGLFSDSESSPEIPEEGLFIPPWNRIPDTPSRGQTRRAQPVHGSSPLAKL